MIEAWFTRIISMVCSSVRRTARRSALPQAQSPLHSATRRSAQHLASLPSWHTRLAVSSEEDRLEVCFRKLSTESLTDRKHLLIVQISNVLGCHVASWNDSGGKIQHVIETRGDDCVCHLRRILMWDGRGWKTFQFPMARLSKLTAERWTNQGVDF